MIQIGNRTFITIEEALRSKQPKRRRRIVRSRAIRQARRQAVVEAYFSGMSAKSVAEKHGISIGYVYTLAADYRRWEKSQKEE